LLVAALLAGGLGEVLRLPKVTSYLLVGVLLGPSVFHWIPSEHVHKLEPLTRLAIALVLFNLGCHFPLPRMRRISGRVLRLAAGELLLTMALVSVGLGVLGESWYAAVLLGSLALATAPATTILVLAEMESEGPVTEYARALVAVNNLVSIVLFEVLFVGVHFLQGKLDAHAGTELASLVRDVAGSIALGVAAGLAISFCYALVAQSRRLVLLVALVALSLGACEVLDVPYLLAFLAMGITVANSSYQGRDVVAELDRLTGLLCVVFFVTHGAELDLAALVRAGLIGVAYIVLRGCGKYFGIALAGTFSSEEKSVQHWLGAALFSQAGAAIALTAIAARRDPVLGEHLQTIILGTVVVFEIAGPLLIRQSVLRAGEVPLARAIRHSTGGPLEELQTIWSRLNFALGRDPWKNRSSDEIRVSEITRKNVGGIAQWATFDEVIEQIEHSRDDTYPVVSELGELIGVIRYPELSSALFDSTLGPLVRAADVATPAEQVLYADDPAARALAMFQAGKDDCIPVVTREKPHRLLGVVRRRDVLRMLIRSRSGGASGGH
jgi:Kef-type K+ transport system membrane component KefB